MMDCALPVMRLSTLLLFVLLHLIPVGAAAAAVSVIMLQLHCPMRLGQNIQLLWKYLLMSGRECIVVHYRALSLS